MKSKAIDHGIVLSLVVDNRLKPVTMDSNGIHQCLLNLVTNAFDACLESDPAVSEQKIDLSVGRSDDGHLVYSVTDTCKGMDESTKNRLFQRFFTTKGDKGTGIGLMLTRKIIHRHSGTIQVESEPGQGSRFTISLPMGDEV
jgi:signal transduction histidine kinase